MRSPGLAIAIAAAVVVGMLAIAVFRVAAPDAPRFHGTAYEPPQPAHAFTLTDHRGQPAALGDFAGQTVLLFFGFANCPDVCPLTLQKLSRIVEDLGGEARPVRIVLITVDPARDTPAALARYVARFGPHVTGLTGDPAELAAVRKAFGVYAGPHPGSSDVEMTHTPAVFGIDRSGRLRVLLPMHEPDEVVARDIRTLSGL